MANCEWRIVEFQLFRQFYMTHFIGNFIHHLVIRHSPLKKMLFKTIRSFNYISLPFHPYSCNRQTFPIFGQG
jgi:hypothetical protein